MKSAIAPYKAFEFLHNYAVSCHVILVFLFSVLFDCPFCTCYLVSSILVSSRIEVILIYCCKNCMHNQITLKAFSVSTCQSIKCQLNYQEQPAKYIPSC